jgi:hypothetical protein
MFELRFLTRLENDDGQIRVLNDYTYWCDDPNIGAIYIEDAWVPAALETDVPEADCWDLTRSRLAVDHRRFEPSEFCYFLYLPVTDENCRVLLDRPISFETEYAFACLAPSTERLRVLFPHNSVGSLIEHTLVNPRQAGFDLCADLEHDAKSKISRFGEIYEQRRQTILQAHQKRLDGETP